MAFQRRCAASPVFFLPPSPPEAMARSRSSSPGVPIRFPDCRAVTTSLSTGCIFFKKNVGKGGEAKEKRPTLRAVSRVSPQARRGRSQRLLHPFNIISSRLSPYPRSSSKGPPSPSFPSFSPFLPPFLPPSLPPSRPPTFSPSTSSSFLPSPVSSFSVFFQRGLEGASRRVGMW